MANDFMALKKSSIESLKNLVNKINSEKEKKVDTRFWQPETDKSGNGFYIIRFLPEPPHNDMPFVTVYIHSFNENGKWFNEKCPTTIGEKCPVCDQNYVLWKTGEKAKQDIVRARKRNVRYISNILVIEDSKNPENEGKVFLFRFGKKIFEKIENALNPKFEDEQKFNPFDFWNGANFKLKIINFDGYRNYDKSSFDSVTELFDGDDTKIERIWRMEYDLREFVDPSLFKSYEELKERFEEVVQSNNTRIEKVKKDNSYIKDESNDEESIEKIITNNHSNEDSFIEQKVKSLNKNDEDDDLSMYRKLLMED